MISKAKEIIALFEHILSLIGTIVTIYINKNSNIQFLAFMNMWQHIIKIVRIVIYGFELVNAPVWFCNLHAFFNYFSNNAVILIACFLIFNLYASIKYPLYFSKYNKSIRPYIYAFTIVYSGGFILASLYEPLFHKYNYLQIAERHNCSSAYRYRLYQYILDSPLNNILFIILAIYCTSVIIYKVAVMPRSSIRRNISRKSIFSNWIVILWICFAISVLSLLNLVNDIKNGIKAEKGIKETESLGITYYMTASIGIIIMLTTVSPKQMKQKLGMIEVSNHSYSTESLISNSDSSYSRKINILSSISNDYNSSSDYLLINDELLSKY